MRRTYKNSLSQKSREYSVQPNEGAWGRLEGRLSEHRSGKNQTRLWLLSAAAVLVLMVSFLFVFNTNNEVYQPRMTALAALSTETAPDDGIYNVSKLSDLKNAYIRIYKKSGL
jgi:hypothetical protein